MTTIQITCRSCNQDFDFVPKRGRRPVECPECKAKKSTGSEETLESLLGDHSLENEMISNLEKELSELKEETTEESDPKEDKTFSYEVFVGNGIDYVYRGESLLDAEKKYAEYCAKSYAAYGQVGLEIVQLRHFGIAIKSIDPAEELRKERNDE